MEKRGRVDEKDQKQDFRRNNKMNSPEGLNKEEKIGERVCICYFVHF